MKAWTQLKSSGSKQLVYFWSPSARVQFFCLLCFLLNGIIERNKKFKRTFGIYSNPNALNCSLLLGKQFLINGINISNSIIFFNCIAVNTNFYSVLKKQTNKLPSDIQKKKQKSWLVSGNLIFWEIHRAFRLHLYNIIKLFSIVMKTGNSSLFSFVVFWRNENWVI